jgi:hypothetical protein
VDLVHVADPFGNRIELIERRDAGAVRPHHELGGTP